MPSEIQCSQCAAMMTIDARQERATCPYCNHEIVLEREAPTKSASDQIRAAHMKAAWDKRMAESSRVRNYWIFWLLFAVLVVGGTLWFVMFMIT